MSREAEIVEAVRRLAWAGNAINMDTLAKQLESVPSLNWPPHTWQVTARAVLRTLEAARLVWRDGLHSFHAFPAFVAEPGDGDVGNQGDGAARIRGDGGAGNQGDGGAGNRPPSVPAEGSDGGGDAPGGAGFRELLSHPDLFSLPEDDFRRLLEGIGAKV